MIVAPGGSSWRYESYWLVRASAVGEWRGLRGRAERYVMLQLYMLSLYLYTVGIW